MNNPTPSRLPTIGLIFAIAVLLGITLFFWQLHSGPYWQGLPSNGRLILAAFSLLAYGLLCGFIFWSRRASHTSNTISMNTQTPTNNSALAGTIVAWASQNGFAQTMAERSAFHLQNVDSSVQLLPLEKVTVEQLAQTQKLIIVASTTGEGDAPDHAMPFVRNVMRVRPKLPHLQHAILAFGDSSYENFCGFGRQLGRWLQQQGSTALFPTVEVDNADEEHMAPWRGHLITLMGVDAEVEMPALPPYEPWQLVERKVLNAGSEGSPVFHIELRAHKTGLAKWQAGDIAVIQPRNAPQAVDAVLKALQLDGQTIVEAEGESLRLKALLAKSQLPDLKRAAGTKAQALVPFLKPLPHREYTIASLPEQQTAHLLVRQMSNADGSLGLGSGWLCEYAAIGDDVALSIRSNPSFHAPEDDRPMILIGNGTGIAGLRAHLQARINAGFYRNWLLFGERNTAHDLHYREQIEQWETRGYIQRLDLAFSRDGNKCYVQALLRQAADTLQEWVEQGAAIYVCGDLRGMSQGVDEVITEVLGATMKEQLLQQGLYKRDVY